MPEVAVAGEDHGHAGFVSGGDDFFVTDGSAGLDAGGGAGIDGGLEAVGKWEHRVGCNDAAFGVETGFFSFPDGDA